jgi:hypothetical protein
MSKISYYPSADEPLQLSDRLIGTEAPRIPASPTPLATKNFSLGELLQLFSGNFPAASLQAVLDTGNTATQNITLTGTIISTVMKPTNIEDTSGSQGITFQVLSKGASSINWVNMPIDNLQAVLNAGSVATGNITLVGDITSTKIIPGNIQDDTAGIGTVGQVLSKTSTGIRWIANPAIYTAGLADVLSVGNTSYIPIFIEDANYSSEISTSYISVTDLLLGSTSYLSADGSLGLGNGIIGALLKTTNVTQSITLEFPNKPLGAYTIATTADLPDVTGFVPYTGATQDVDLGNNDLLVNEIFLYDGPNDNYGSVHYTDGNFHIEDGDGHPLLVIEDEFIQIHKNAIIQSNLWTSGLTAIRDHYLPNQSGTIALTVDLDGYVPYTGATSDVDLGVHDLKAKSVETDSVILHGTDIESLMIAYAVALG